MNVHLTCVLNKKKLMRLTHDITNTSIGGSINFERMLQPLISIFPLDLDQKARLVAIKTVKNYPL